MPLDGESYLCEEDQTYLDTITTNTALHSYGLISVGFELNEGQREYFNNLERPIQSKIWTLATRLHNQPETLSVVTRYIEEWNTFAAETTLMQVVDEMKRVRLDETKMEYYETIHDYIAVLAASDFGPQIQDTKSRVKETLDA